MSIRPASDTYMTQKFHAEARVPAPGRNENWRAAGRSLRGPTAIFETSFLAKAKNCAVDHIPTVGCE